MHGLSTRGGLILYRTEVNSSQITVNATLYFGERVHDSAIVRAPFYAIALAHGVRILPGKCRQSHDRMT